jgi:hypothetical protein
MPPRRPFPVAAQIPAALQILAALPFQAAALLPVLHSAQNASDASAVFRPAPAPVRRPFLDAVLQDPLALPSVCDRKSACRAESRPGSGRGTGPDPGSDPGSDPAWLQSPVPEEARCKPDAVPFAA